jgi:glycerate kinase
MDEQTLSGKVVKGVADLGRKYQKCVIAVVGKNELPESKTTLLGVQQVITLVDRKTSEKESFNQTYQLIKKRISEQVIPFFL